MADQITIKDGIVKKTDFEGLLWILKEANDKESTKGWDMKFFLRNRESGLFTYSNWRSTFGLICKISIGILNKSLSYEDVNSFGKEELTNVLDKIAFINIKKVPGGSTVDYRKFADYIKDKKNMEIIRKQIKDINPTLVICGNTFQYVFNYIFPNIPDFNLNKNWIHRHNGIKYVNGWHPNARVNHEKYFNDIRREIQLS